jgi:hypothetical protein
MAGTTRAVFMNLSHPPVAAPRSRVRVAVEPTNEEWIAASHARRLLRGGAAVDQGYAVA